jgi:cyclophilin family peptidyl-prolyl cis-trans isomerase
MKRFKMLAAAILALAVAQPAFAQGGQGQRRRPPEPVNTVAPIFIAPTSHTATATPALQPENTWVLDLSNGGRVSIQLRPDAAPSHVERIKALTRNGFYNGLTFHRVIEGFMAQGGDPAGNGSGESSLPDLTAEFNDLPHLRGTVAMARTQDPNSANSQFYIMFVPRLSMDREYTVFGRVVAGMDVVDRITRGEPPAQPTRIVRASIGSDNVAPPTAAEIAAANTPPAPAQADGLTVMNVPSLTGSPTQRQQTPPPAPGTTTPQN